MTTTDYKTYWKTLAHSKNIRPHNVIEYCILKALKCKSNDKVGVLHALLSKSFTAKDGRWECFPSWRLKGAKIEFVKYGQLPDGKWGNVKVAGSLLGVDPKLMLNDLEITQYGELLASIETSKLTIRPKVVEEPYSYFFVRQDIPAEYQMVQGMHVAAVLGAKMPGVDWGQTNFVLIGVPDLEALLDVRKELADRYRVSYGFVEPDIGNELTAIATAPLTGYRRKHLSRYTLLRFAQ